MMLTGPQKQQLSDALTSAFPTVQEFTVFLDYRLSKNIQLIATPSANYGYQIFQVLQRAEAENWTGQLVAAAREANPGNPRLLAFAQQFGLASTKLGRDELESLISKEQGFLDVAKWRMQLGLIETRVCRVEFPKGTPRGTGFLVGSNTLLTNHHVVQPIINGKVPPADVVLRFDYKRMEDGTTINEGTCFELASNWLIDASPPSPVDLEGEPKSALPAPDQLDYALLRISGAPGDTPVGEKPEPGAPPRGWVAMPTSEVKLIPNTSLLIIQHPLGEPLKLALDRILGENGNKTRVTYTTNSQKGSSGSPCFNINWELVALHHSGDPNSEIGLTPTANQGIPFVRIMERLKQSGHAKYLGKQDLD